MLLLFPEPQTEFLCRTDVDIVGIESYGGHFFCGCEWGLVVLEGPFSNGSFPSSKENTSKGSASFIFLVTH